MPRNAATQENTNNTENMEQQVPFEVTITEHNPERGVLANADVNVAGIMTIRNVKIKQDDYGLTVTMPRTKMPHTEQYKQPYGTGAWLCFLSDSPQQGSRNTVSGGRYAGRTWTKREQGI